MATNRPTWRDHYLELLRDGEAAGLRGSALGHYIGQRMTNAELIAALVEYHEHRGRLGLTELSNPTTEGQP